MLKNYSSLAIFSAILCPTWASAQPLAPDAAAPPEEKAGEETTPVETTDGEGEPGVDSSEDASEVESGAPVSSKDEPTEGAASTEGIVATPAPPAKQAPPYRGPATLLDGPHGELHVGGYGGLSVLGTGINGTAGVLVGAEGAILLDHRFALGLAFHGLSSEVRGPAFSDGDASVLGFGYGGPVMRYQLMSPKSPVTLSLGALIGAGGLTLVRRLADNDYEFDETYAANAYFVAEPSAQVHLHLTRFMRLGVSGGYRFVVGPNLGAVTDSDLQGVTAGGHLQFGWF